MSERTYTIQGLPIPEAFSFSVENGKVTGIACLTEPASIGLMVMQYFDAMPGYDQERIEHAVLRAQRKELRSKAKARKNNKGEQE